MSNLDDFRTTYFEECAELLLELEEQFTALAREGADSQRINAAFRAVHSIKGGGGAFGFTDLVAFAHAYETLLDDVRGGRVALTPLVIALCINSNDVLADFVAAVRTGRPLPPDHGANERSKFLALTEGGWAAALPVLTEISQQEAAQEQGGATEDEIGGDAFTAPLIVPEDGVWQIRFVPHPELYARANDPILLFRELATLGELNTSAIPGKLPQLADFDPFGVYCSWEMTLVSPLVTEAQIREVFEFVEGICDLEIAAADASHRPLPAASPDPAADRMPEFVAEVREAAAVAAGTSVALDAPARVDSSRHDEEPVELSNDTAAADLRNSVQSIRVDLEKVDRVVNIVGELVIAQSMLTQHMDEKVRSRYYELVRGLEVLEQTTRGLQDAVMAIRAQPVKTVFSRLPRLVRELASSTGKKLRLETSGDMTEIDKTVIEHLGDPLTHMIRNAAGHGIEPPEVRVAAGKPETGTIRLKAEQAGGSIVICLEDDGAGINRKRVLEVARRRGLIGHEAQLSDEQIDALIFAPGFTTAEAVSDLSGRGVGMDVVVSNVKKIGGAVHVRSTPGRGTRMTLRLPLTLAVVDVMHVKVAGSPYVLPLSSIIETHQCARAEFNRTPSGAPLLRIRGEYVRVIDLAARLGFRAASSLETGFIVLCEGEGAAKVALVVEDIVGQQQVVIKSLEQNFGAVEGIAGATILGDGSVALIIDVHGVDDISRRERAA